MKKKINNKNLLFFYINLTFFSIIFRFLITYKANTSILLCYFLLSFLIVYFGYFKKFYGMISIYYLISYCLIVFYRSEEIFIYGRFFAEEGAVFWSFSLSNNYFDILQYLLLVGGYFTFNVNIIMTIIKILPIEYAPFVSIYSSLFIMILPAYLATKYNIFKLSKLEKNYVFGLYLFLQSLNWSEVALNSINSQVYLGVAVFFILTFGLKNSSFKFKIFEQIILAVGFLSSFYAVVQFPIIILRYINKKNNYILYTLFLTFLTSSLQILIFYFSKITNILYFEKANNLPSIDYIYNVFTQSFFINLVSIKYSNLINIISIKFYLNYKILILLSVVFIIIIFLVYFSKFSLKINTTNLILINILLQWFLIVYGQAGVYFSQRYAVVLPTIAFTFVLLTVNKLFKNKIIYFIAFSFLLNTASFNLHNTESFFSCGNSCIKWSNQLNNNVILHWPMDGNWITDLKKPEPLPANFQIENFNFNVEKYYNYKLSNLFSELFFN